MTPALVTSCTIAWCRGLSYDRDRSAKFGTADIAVSGTAHTHRYENRAVVPHHYQRCAVS